MEGFENVAAESDLPEGGIKGVTVDGAKVVLVKLSGAVYALGAVCTHKGGNLAEGWLQGEMIRCPEHDSGFDVRTGEAVKPPARTPEPAYEVRVEDGRIWVSSHPKGGAP